MLAGILGWNHSRTYQNWQRLTKLKRVNITWYFFYSFENSLLKTLHFCWYFYVGWLWGSAADVSALHQLLADQANIPKEEGIRNIDCSKHLVPLCHRCYKLSPKYDVLYSFLYLVSSTVKLIFILIFAEESSWAILKRVFGKNSSSKSMEFWFIFLVIQKMAYIYNCESEFLSNSSL